jgi:putative transposase
MLLAHRIRLTPNNVQASYLIRAAGTARFAYNWALVEWQRQYQANLVDPAVPKPNEAALRRRLNAIKRTEFPWMLEVTKNAPQMAIIQLGRAFKNFFARRARFPKFRRKGHDDRFTLSNNEFRVEGKRIRIPKLGWVRMRESLRFAGHIVSASVSRLAGHWFASIIVDMSDGLSLPPAENQGAVGVDLGVKQLATLSTGETFAGPKALRNSLDRLRSLSRAVSRKVKGSRNRGKAGLKLAKLYARIANRRRESLHQLTTNITRRFHTIGIEDLDVKRMLSNRRLSRAIADMGFGELRRQLVYKAAWRGGQVVVVDRWYPSSKTCSCGYRLEALGLDQRQWTCPGCEIQHDRDVNAAINLRNMAVSSTVSACRGEGAGLARKRRTKPAPLKQESSSE